MVYDNEKKGVLFENNRPTKVTKSGKITLQNEEHRMIVVKEKITDKEGNEKVITGLWVRICDWEPSQKRNENSPDFVKSTQIFENKFTVFGRDEIASKTNQPYTSVNLKLSDDQNQNNKSEENDSEFSEFDNQFENTVF
tara:strand:- start:428 stop:844 length:417 start_codon:yes stop_codon:yes gene_type:complete